MIVIPTKQGHLTKKMKMTFSPYQYNLPYLMAYFTMALVLWLYQPWASANPQPLALEPIELQQWLPAFAIDSEPSTSSFRWQDKSNQRYQRLCAIIPPSDSSYWFAINYGLVKTARSYAINLRIFSPAHGAHQQNQINIVNKCLSNKPDAIIISSSYINEYGQLLRKASHLATMPPLVAIGKDRVDQTISGATSPNYHQIGQIMGEYLNHQPHTPIKQPIAIFPNSDTMPYVRAFMRGVSENIDNRKYQINDVVYTSESFSEIKAAIDSYINDNLDTSMIIASGRVAQAAVEVLYENAMQNNIQIISYELTAQVYRDIKRGNIRAAITTLPVIQGMLAVDLALKTNETSYQPLHVSPQPMIVDKGNITLIDISQVFAPYGYRETLEVN